jgi:hypothetical protein
MLAILNRHYATYEFQLFKEEPMRLAREKKRKMEHLSKGEPTGFEDQPA